MEEPEQWVTQLRAPIPGEKVSAETYEDDLASFTAVQGAIGGG